MQRMVLGGVLGMERGCRCLRRPSPASGCAKLRRLRRQRQRSTRKAKTSESPATSSSLDDFDKMVFGGRETSAAAHHALPGIHLWYVS